jgi:hypothetical protein
MEVKLANDWLISVKRNAIVVYIHVNNFSAVSLPKQVTFWCADMMMMYGRLYFIVHPHCMKCCSTRTLYPTYTRTHFTDFETIGHCCCSFMPQGPWLDPIGDRTHIYYTRVQNSYQYTWQVLSLVYIRMKKVKYISGQYILHGNTSFLRRKSGFFPFENR